MEWETSGDHSVEKMVTEQRTVTHPLFDGVGRVVAGQRLYGGKEGVSGRVLQPLACGLRALVRALAHLREQPLVIRVDLLALGLRQAKIRLRTGRRMVSVRKDVHRGQQDSVW